MSSTARPDQPPRLPRMIPLTAPVIQHLRADWPGAGESWDELAVAANKPGRGDRAL